MSSGMSEAEATPKTKSKEVTIKKKLVVVASFLAFVFQFRCLIAPMFVSRQRLDYVIGVTSGMTDMKRPNLFLRNDGEEYNHQRWRLLLGELSSILKSLGGKKMGCFI